MTPSDPLELRPHHILDIIRNHGHGFELKPHPYGHAVHSVASTLISNPDIEIRLVCRADAICGPCIHLRADGTCDDVLSQLETPVSKQRYNDDLDLRLFSYLKLSEGAVLSFRGYCGIVKENVPGIEAVCSHPKEDPDFRLTGLKRGLEKLGIA